MNFGMLSSSVISRAFSVPTCKSVVPSTTIIAPDTACIAEVSSPAKSKYPGVSIKLYLLFLYSIENNPIEEVYFASSVGFEILFVNPAV